MKKLSLLILSVVLFAAVPQSSQADLYYGDIMLSGTVSLKFQNKVSSVYLTPMEVTNIDTGATFVAYCGDFLTSTSGSFSNPSVGQEYGAHSLNSPSLQIYSTWQKEMIGDLFGYAHAVGFNEDGSIKNSLQAQAIQLVVWEILTESITGEPVRDMFSLQAGDFGFNGTGNANLTNLTNQYFDALFGVLDWESDLGLSFIDYDMTVYVAEPGNHASQTLISVTNAAATPEPSSMLIFGVALGALPLVRRRFKKANA